MHDVEGLAAFTGLRDASAAELPLIGDRVQGLLALANGTAVVFDRRSPRLGDVAQVHRDGAHATAATGDLDHHLRRATHDRRADALAQGLGTLMHRQAGEHRRPRRLRAVRGVEQSVAPSHEQASMVLGMSGLLCKRAMSADARSWWRRISASADSRRARQALARSAPARRSNVTSALRSAESVASWSLDASSAARSAWRSAMGCGKRLPFTKCATYSP